MTIQNPNTTLLQAKNVVVSDRTPAPLSGPSNAVGFLFAGVQPPSLFYVQRDDVFVMQAATSQTNESVAFNVRVMLPSGRIEESQFILRPLNTRTVLTQSFQMSEGYLLSVAATATQATTRGQTFARAFINRPIFGVNQPAQTIFADYVTNFVSSGYPNGRIVAPTEGPGFIYTPTIGNPGPGVDWTTSVPPNARWRIRGWTASFTANATVANRNISFEIQYAGNDIFRSSGLVAVTASQAVRVCASPLTPWIELVALSLMLPLPPDLVITPTLGNSAVLQVVTQNMQAGDAWTFIGMLIEEWLDNV